MLTTLDWIVIISFLVLILIVGISYTKSSGKNIESFFLGGRNLPWWLAGLSMVATTFAADTPLAVTEIVGRNGIAGNWIWWNFLAGGMLTTFFFARLWQRSGVLTEVEFIELRYSGKPARFLRGFKAVYLGLFMNILVIGWVNVAMTTLLQVFFDITPLDAFLWTGGIMLAVAFYSSLAGLMGVAVTDAIQFVIAIIGCVLLAVFVINSPDIGGIEGLKTQLNAMDTSTLNFFPSLQEGDSVGSTLGLNIAQFISYIGIIWWASWYPGAEPGGGGYIAQRMMSTRSEKDSFWATLFFQIAHYCIRPWPWILVGLAAITLYAIPHNLNDAQLKAEVYELKLETGLGDELFTKNITELQYLAKDNEKVAQALPTILALNEKLAQKAQKDPKLQNALQYAAQPRRGFVLAMRDYLPAGLLGLLLVAFFAAYMSTISTQLNWGAGYLVNDLYKRFIKQDEQPKHYVFVSRITTILLAIIGLCVSYFIESISGAWEFLMQAGAGLGLVLILRWYWWRVNAWAEIVAMVVPILVSIPMFIKGLAFEHALPVTVGVTTLAWVLTAYLAPGTSIAQLQLFYEKVKPLGNWRGLEVQPKNGQLASLVAQWLIAILFTYSILFCIGNAVLFEWTNAGILLILVLVSGFLLKRLMDKLG